MNGPDVLRKGEFYYEWSRYIMKGRNFIINGP